MVKFEVSVQINRPIEEVFAFLADPAKLPEWNAIVEESRPEETPIRVGTKIQQRAKFLGRRIDSTAEVVEYETNKRFATRADKPFPVMISNRFESGAGGTKVVANFEGEPGGFFKFGETILTRIATKQFQAQLETAKEILEAPVPAQR